jgi:hypothetical protein
MGNEAQSSHNWAIAGFFLLFDCFHALFRVKLRPDETWSEFIIEKLGLLVLILFALGMIGLAFGLVYVKILH